MTYLSCKSCIFRDFFQPFALQELQTYAWNRLVYVTKVRHTAMGFENSM
jgi:hypothetical protein